MNLTSKQIALVLSELLLFSLLTYFGGKWLAKILDPTYRQKQAASKQAEKVMKSLGLAHLAHLLTDYEMSVAALLVDPLSVPVSWRDIGGLDSIICGIKESVILPFRNRAHFNKSSLLAPPKGVLLYGPPGCGKTMIAKATAKEAGCRFINLDIAALKDKWYGESEKITSAVFSLAAKMEPCIIFIDEIESFLRTRSEHDHEVSALMKAQFLNLWDGLLSQSDCSVILMGATNRPKDIDLAVLRRMPCRFFVDLPDEAQRCSILRIMLADEKLHSDVSIEELASITRGYSGSDLNELCRIAALKCYTRQLSGDDSEGVEQQINELSPICHRDFADAIDRMVMNQQIFRC